MSDNQWKQEPYKEYSSIVIIQGVWSKREEVSWKDDYYAWYHDYVKYLSVYFLSFRETWIKIVSFDMDQVKFSMASVGRRYEHITC